MTRRQSQRCEAAMADPESIGRYAEPDAADCEEMLYVAKAAYERRTGSKMPDDPVDRPRRAEPAGARWEEDDLELLYPRLWKKFE